MQRTYEAIRDCPCDTGCPVCVHSPKCGSGNRPIDKNAAKQILQMLLEQEPGQGGSALAPPAAHTPVFPDVADLKKATHEKKLGLISPKRYAVLDIETRRSAKQVGGWHKAERMGVSCAVLYDSLENDFLVYYQDDMATLVERLGQMDLIIGFNITRFDYKVLSGLSRFNFHSLPTLDILTKVHERLGYRLSLDHLACQTLGLKKSADGLLALKWWQEGRLDLIVDYCTQDVRVTHELYAYGRDNGFLIFKNKAGHHVRIPVDWK